MTSALKEKPRPGQPSMFNKAAQAHLTALACGEAQEGRSRWTLRLLADRLVELRLVEAISYKTVGEQLKKSTQALAQAAADSCSSISLQWHRPPGWTPDNASLKSENKIKTRLC